MATVALVGCGHTHTPGFVKRLQARTDVTVKYVWDHQPERATKQAQVLSTRTIAEVGEVWSDPQIEGVIICSETNRHEPLVLAAGAVKKHIFVEKPLGMGAADAYHRCCHTRPVTPAKDTAKPTASPARR